MPDTNLLNKLIKPSPDQELANWQQGYNSPGDPAHDVRFAWGKADSRLQGATQPFMDQWGNAIGNANLGAAQYLADMESGKNSVIQKQAAQGLAQNRVGMAAPGRGFNPLAQRAGILGGSAAGSNLVGSAATARGNEMLGANQFGASTGMQVAGQYGQQAGQALNTQIAGMNYALGVEGLDQERDAANNKMAMQAVGTGASALGGAGAMMSDKRVKRYY